MTRLEWPCDSQSCIPDPKHILCPQRGQNGSRGTCWIFPADVAAAAVPCTEFLNWFQKNFGFLF